MLGPLRSLLSFIPFFILFLLNRFHFSIFCLAPFLYSSLFLFLCDFFLNRLLFIFFFSSLFSLLFIFLLFRCKCILSCFLFKRFSSYFFSKPFLFLILLVFFFSFIFVFRSVLIFNFLLCPFHFSYQHFFSFIPHFI